MTESLDRKVERLLDSAITALSKIKKLPTSEREEYVWLNVSSRLCRAYDEVKTLEKKNKGELYYQIFEIYCLNVDKIQGITNKMGCTELFLQRNLEPKDYDRWLKLQK